MILNMVTGTAAKVKAIAVDEEQALPVKAAEGTIAVVTNVAIGSVFVQNEAPASPAAGDVWVNTGVSSMAPVQVGNATLYPSAVKQYITGEWKSVSAYVLTSEGWQTLEMYLFRDGDLFENMTGGWLAAWQMAGVAAIGDAALEAAYGTANQEYNRVAFCTKDTVDLSAYKTLRASFVQTRQHTRTNIAVGVTSTPFAEGKLAGDRETVINTPELCMNGYTNITTKQTSAFTLEYDISALTDSMHVVVYFGSVECICTSVQLVP